MPVSSFTLSLSINQSLTVKQFLGKNASDIASAVANALGQILLIPNVVLCTLSGTAGPSGLIINTGVFGLNATAMSSLMRSKAVSKKIIGRDASKFFEAISLGVVNTLYTLTLSGSSIGCALGVGSGRFVGINPQVLSGKIFLELTRRSLIGKNTADLANIIGFGIATHLQTTVTVPVTVTGAIAPVPPVGPIPVAGIPSTTTQIS